MSSAPRQLVSVPSGAQNSADGVSSPSPCLSAAYCSGDEFHFGGVSPASGDFDFVAKLAMLAETGEPFMKAGIMARASVDAASPFFFFSWSPRPEGAAVTNAVQASHRLELGGNATYSPGERTCTSLNDLIPNCWMRITRVGDFFRAYFTEDIEQSDIDDLQAAVEATKEEMAEEAEALFTSDPHTPTLDDVAREDGMTVQAYSAMRLQALKAHHAAYTRYMDAYERAVAKHNETIKKLAKQEADLEHLRARFNLQEKRKQALSAFTDAKKNLEHIYEEERALKRTPLTAAL